MSGTTTVRRRARVLARCLVVAVSAAVLAVSAFAWGQVRVLDRSTAAAVIGPAPAAAPAAEQNILLLGVDSRTQAVIAASKIGVTQRPSTAGVD